MQPKVLYNKLVKRQNKDKTTEMIKNKKKTSLKRCRFKLVKSACEKVCLKRYLKDILKTDLPDVTVTKLWTTTNSFSHCLCPNKDECTFGNKTIVISNDPIIYFSVKIL